MKEFQITSMTCYLSGPDALNIPMPDYTTGDWHMLGTFFQSGTTDKMTFLAGEGQEVNTFYLFKDWGISDRTKDAERYGIQITKPLFCADHFRAICDMVIKSVIRGRCANHICLDDYIPEDCDKKIVLNKLYEIFPLLKTEQQQKLLQWINKNVDL